MNSFEPLPFSFVLLGSPVYMDGAERRTLGGVIHTGRRSGFDVHRVPSYRIHRGNVQAQAERDDEVQHHDIPLQNRRKPRGRVCACQTGCQLLASDLISPNIE